MFVLRREPGAWLFQNLHYFNTFLEEQKQQILCRTLKSFFVCKSDEIEHEMYDSILKKIYKKSVDLPEIKKLVSLGMSTQMQMLFYDKSKLDSWEDLEYFFFTIFKFTNGKMYLLAAILCDIKLYESGLCPLLFYSFDRWHWGEGDSNQLKCLVEFSLMYLYRFIRVDVEAPLGSYQKLDGSGATSSVYLDNKNTVCKTPKNLAALRYIFPQENEISTILVKSDLGVFIPAGYRYENKCHALYHEYVQGKSGLHYLNYKKELSIEQMESLRVFYNSYCALGERRLILDIHPGNFVWNDQKRQWYLIDLGPLPEIGREYYEFDAFERYYEDIWLGLEEKMHKYPIRSVDLFSAHESW